MAVKIKLRKVNWFQMGIEPMAFGLALRRSKPLTYQDTTPQATHSKLLSSHCCCHCSGSESPVNLHLRPVGVFSLFDCLSHCRFSVILFRILTLPSFIFCLSYHLDLLSDIQEEDNKRKNLLSSWFFLVKEKTWKNLLAWQLQELNYDCCFAICATFRFFSRVDRRNCWGTGYGATFGKAGRKL